MITKEKAYNINKNKIDWSKVKYPNYCNNFNLNNKQKAKKRELFRNKCTNYIISENKLYKKSKNYDKTKIKYIILLETEKLNLIIQTHRDNGHLGSIDVLI